MVLGVEVEMIWPKPLKVLAERPILVIE